MLVTNCALLHVFFSDYAESTVKSVMILNQKKTYIVHGIMTASMLTAAVTVTNLLPASYLIQRILIH